MMHLMVAAVLAGELRVLGPKEVARTIPFEVTPLGTSPQAISIHGKIVIAEGDGCAPLPKLPLVEGAPKGFFLFDGEQCSPGLKARNAQAANGYLVIVYSDKPLDLSTTPSVRIPVVQVGAEAGKLLKNYLAVHRDQELLVQASFSTSRGSKAKVEVFLSTGSATAFPLLLEVGELVKKLGSQAELVPVYVTAERFQGGDVMGCLSGGRYCAPERGAFQLDYAGKAVVWQDLRQVIIFSEFRDKYLNYVMAFAETCQGRLGTFANQEELDKCSAECMLESGLNFGAVEESMKKSFLGPNPKVDDNEYLLAEQQQWKAAGLALLPGVRLNGRVVEVRDWSTGGTQVSLEVCKQFAPKYNEPCKEMSGRFGGEDNFLLVSLLIVAGVMVVVTGGCLAMYRKVLRQRMEDELGREVRQSMQQYRRFTELTAGERGEV